ncbi:nucleotidyl transferase AbiEii/AbiGii toxin family protein [Pararhizobium sp. IMCC21322]|uniref:nucleotidyl transferase AbiEii/AbiGii toxin family protein n=1 Tax=Pararhizobium sp. IMCC21322 TaxID=3067903 RepID=UPI0027403678|nr:nucleotidyl transferase AbiEii/AbiGii toxin family protein [Pararhizobium sp. IMCC21322]
MIPETNITAWSQVAPWAEPRQVEQDLIISRALVDIFNHDLLGSTLRFRGGTALNKIIFPKPLRYSEDIDLVRTEAGPIGPVLDALRDVLEPWLGQGSFASSQVAPKLRFRVPAEDDPDAQIRLKIEINIAEIEAFDAPVSVDYEVDNPWFSGATTIATFSAEELLATKLRALLQRDKGRDLFDLDHALKVLPNLDVERMIEIFGRYLDLQSQVIGRPEAERRMLAKYAKPDLLADIRALLTPDIADEMDDAAGRSAFIRVFTDVVERIPGQRWARMDEIALSLGLVELADSSS